MKKNTLYWFNNDLRLSDLPGLRQAQENGPVMPIYILDKSTPWPVQGAAAWWLHSSLKSLSQGIKELDNTLYLYEGEPLSIIKSIAKHTAIE